MEFESVLDCGCCSGKCPGGFFNVFCAKDNPYQGLPKDFEGQKIVSIRIVGKGEYVTLWDKLQLPDVKVLVD